MKNIFFNRYQNRLRSGWRILIYFLLFFAIFVLISLIIKNFIPIQIIRSLIGFLVIPVIALGTLWLGGRYLDHRKFKDYEFNFSRRWWLDFIFGIILGALLFCIVFLFEKAMGWIKIVDYFQGLIFGFPVSGEHNNLSIIAIEQNGPQIWTGGAFGPEGGLVGSIALVVGCAFVLLWFKILQRPMSLFTKMAEYNSSNLSRKDIALTDNSI